MIMNINPDRKNRTRPINLRIAAQTSLLLGVLVLCLFIYFRCIWLFSIAFFCLTLIAPSLAILSYATSLRFQSLKEKRFSLLRICVLIVPFLVGIMGVFRFLLPYLYTPCAITADNYKFYKSCVEFATNYNQQEDISVSWVGYYTKGEACYPNVDSNGVSLQEHFSENEIREMLMLSKQMKKYGCIRFRTSKDVVLFYKHSNWILPTRPGIAFSINGTNPNDVDSDVINEHKPYLWISDGWYASKRLVYAGVRGDIRKSLPKSLIDHSSRTEGLDQD